MRDRFNGKRHLLYCEELELNPCPICGKKPKIRIENRQQIGAGCWVFIGCKKGFFKKKTHIVIGVGKSTYQKALEIAVNNWNRATKEK